MEPPDKKESAKTYIPKRQKDEWREAAEEYDMSLSEFISLMVEAGRSKIGNINDTNLDIRKLILTIIEEKNSEEWKNIQNEAMNKIQEQIDEEFMQLREEGKIKHDPKKGGYVKTDDSE